MTDQANITPFVDPDKPRLKLVRFSDIEPEPVKWLWRPRIPRGKVTILQSRGGEGKSSMAIDLGARITRGRPMPITEERHGPANVFLFSIEDDVSDTHLPRLIAAEGALDRFYSSRATEYTNEDGEPVKGVLSLAHTIEIREAIERLQPLLLIIDPVTSFLGAGVDMHRANEVRPVLEALSDIAQETDTTVLLIHHVNKGGVGGAMYRGIGSVEFGNVARSVLVTGEHNGRRVLAQAKLNIAKKAPSLFYRIGDSLVFQAGEPVGRIIWEEETYITAEELDQAAGSKPGPTPAVDPLDIENFMLELLAEPQTAQSLQKSITRDLGAGKNAFEKARANLRKAGRIDYRKIGYGTDATAYWHRTSMTDQDWEAFARTHPENS